MNVLVTGATGLVGSALVAALRGDGHAVRSLVRSRPDAASGRFAWGPEAGTLDPAALDGLDAVVHLAGESIAGGRWTEARKRRIRESRVRGTTFLADRLAAAPAPPHVLVAASAIGYYGDRGAEVLTEESPPGTGFLAEVCRAWESASTPAEAAGIRTVRLRLGVVLAPTGGMLGKLLLPFRLGLGGKVGDGGQYMSWVAIDDVVGAVRAALAGDRLRGPVNAVAPAPVTNLEFTRALGRVLGRPTVLPLPAFAARLALGEMADELLLASTRVHPARLLEAGYSFRHADIDAALRHVLGRG